MPLSLSSQVCEPRVLFSGRPDVIKQMTNGKTVDMWMWGGISLKEALTKFLQEGELQLCEHELQLCAHELRLCAVSCCA